VTGRELAELARGTFDLDGARAAFGVGDFLVDQEPKRLAMALEAMRAWRDLDNRKPTSNGGWVTDPNYEVAPENVDELLARHLGDDWGAQATAHASELGKRARTRRGGRGR
jgi:hypothetical protein